VSSADAHPTENVRIVGLALVRNEEVFIERAIRNVAAFCDRIHIVDHVSDDDTWPIVRSLARELEHVEAQRSRNSAEAHRLVERYAGTVTWVLGVDGDEIFDPSGLARLRADLISGAHSDVFRIKAHVLNCDRLDDAKCTASGWLAPPSRPITKLFNFGAVESWTDSPDPLQAGRVVFKPGYDWESKRDLSESTTWDTDPLRCLHVCFMPRSRRDSDAGRRGRMNLDESRAFDRGLRGTLKRAIRRPRPAPRISELERQGKNWKLEMYARGSHVTVDAGAFLAT
jgi:Glycosyl transferase family 2